MTIHKQIGRHGISFDEAVAMQKRKHTGLTVDMIKQAISLDAGKFWDRSLKLLALIVVI